MLRALAALLAVAIAIVPKPVLEAQAASMRVTVPSPTAASLGRFGDVPVSLYTGIPDVTIPIFTVNGRTLRLPITLKYQGGGTRVEDIGGWAGIGMALEAGGVITRSVRGVPDDKDAGYLNTGSTFLTWENWQQPSASLIDNIRNGNIDGEPDQYFFSFAGVSGQFAVGPVAPGGGLEYRSVPYRKLRIVPTGGAFAEITGWTITTEDGTRYTFAAAETHTDYSNNSSGSINPNYGQTYYSSWHLTEIRAPGGDVITLQYTPYTAQHKQGTYVEKFDLVQSPPGVPACVPNIMESFNEFMVSGQRLTSITSAAHTVTFTTTLRTDALSPSGAPQEHRLDLITVATAGNTVLRKFKFEHDYSTGRLTLKHVYEQDRNNVALPPHSFTYAGQMLPAIFSKAQDHWGFFNGKETNSTLIPATVVATIPLEGADRSPDPAFANAGVLSRITFPTGGWNEFVWESNDYGTVGTVDAPPVGEGPEQNAMANSGPGVGTTTFTVGGTANTMATFTVNQSPADCGSQIQPPCPYTRVSGGTLTFPYQWDTNGTFTIQLGPGVYTLTADDQGTYPDGSAVIQVRWRDKGNMNKIVGGGLRVAEVRTADAMGNVTVRKYKYTLTSAPSRSSGTIMAEPAYGYYFPGSLCQYYSRTSMSRMPLGNGGPTVAYREVEVWHGANAEFGKTRHLYTSTLTTGAADQSPGSSAWPYSRTTSMEFKRGQPLATTEFNAAGLAQRRTGSSLIFREGSMTEPVTERRFRGLSINTFSAGHTVDAAAWGYVFNPFEVVSAWGYTESDTTVSFDETGASSVTSVRDYSYGNPAHTQLTQTTETNSNGHQRITRTQYPADYAAGAGNAEAVALTAMQADSVHNHSAVVERWVSEKIGTTETVLQATLTTYRAGTARPLPYQTFVLNSSSGVTDFATSAVSGTFSKDYRHLLQETASTYDAWGRLTQLTDPRGNVTNYLYGGTNTADLLQVTRVKDASGIVDLVTALTYDSDGFVSSIRDEGGTYRYFTYDLYGRLRQVKDHAGTVVKAMGYLYSRTLANGWTYQTGSPNAVIDTTFVQQTPSVVRLVSTGYLDGLGRPLQGVQQDGVNHVVSATQYDLLGRSWRVWKPYTRGVAGYDASFVSNATAFYNSYLGQSLAKPFVETQYTTDTLSRVKTVIPEFVGAAATAYTQRAYGVDAAPKHTFVESTDELGKKTRAYADAFGNGIRSILGYSAPEATTTQLTVNVLGQRTSITDPRGLVISYVRNTRGLQTSNVSADAGTRSSKYDGAGNLRFSQDANQAAAGQVAFTSFDFAGRPLITGVGAASFAPLDGDAAPTTLEITTGHWLTVRAYDAKPSGAVFPWNLFTTQITPLTLQGVSGRLAAEAHRSNGAWQVTLFSYDADGRIATRYQYTQNGAGTAVWTALNTVATSTYDLRGKLTFRGLTVGSATWNQWMEYDGRGLLWRVFASTTAVKPATADVKYTYRPSGVPATRQYAGGPNVPFTYTIREQLARIGDPALTTYPFSARYAYHANGRVSEQEFYQAGTPATAKRYRYLLGAASYDALNRLKAADFSSWSGSAWTSTLAFDLTNITYDGAGNLTGLRRYRSAATLVDQLTYAYPGTTNRLSRVADAIAPTAETWDAESGSFTYDANGNLLTAPVPYAITATSYDPWSRALSLTRAGTTTAYRYAAGGQRLSKQVGAGAAEVYITDGPTTLAVFTVPASGTPSAWYFNLLAGERVLGRQPHTGNRLYYHRDLLNSTRAVVSGTTVVESRDYDPWGVELAGRTLGSGTKEGFTGQERDAESGLDAFWARRYLSAVGRWGAVDPLRDSFPEWNAYDYVNGNPVNTRDPLGLCPVCVVAGLWAVYEAASSAYDVYKAGKTVLDPAATTGQKARSVGLAAVGLFAPGGGYTALDDLADAAKVLDRGGLTAAGRQLTKHAQGQRPGSIAFGRLSGNPSQINAAAQDIVEDVLTHPGTTSSVIKTGRFKGGTEFYDPSGRGVRYDAAGKFVGFVEKP